MRFGLGWRRELGAGIVANRDRVDVVEVLAEELFDAGRAERRAMRFLKTQVPVVLHATSLGLASPESVDRRRLDAVARVVEWLEPELWSEHVAFVRAGAAEVGHLAAPPRNDATLEGLVRNVELARRVVGSNPLLENVASLIEPPLSTYGEGEWLRAVLAATDCSLLFDLHNVYANSVNFGFDAASVVRSIPSSRIGAIHLAGGRTIERGRLLDDHLHDVPDPVFELLALVNAPHATVILERDGNYPGIEILLSQLDVARAVVTRGEGYVSPAPIPLPVRVQHAGDGVPLIGFLATLYTDDETRARFLTAPAEAALRAGLSPEDAAGVASIDPADLELAARSFARKRAAKQ